MWNVYLLDVLSWGYQPWRSTLILLTRYLCFPLFKSEPFLTPSKELEANEGQWATDDIPEFLNAIRRETDAGKLLADHANNSVGTVAVSLAAPPPQNLWAKLQEVRLKNPVSGLMEYAQYLGHNCEFQLLDQSGPSHDPRFVTKNNMYHHSLFSHVVILKPS